MTRSQNDMEWENPDNWRGGWLGIYSSRRDTRIIVPKRHRWMGWTINMGQPLGRVAGYGLLVFVVLAIVGSWL